MREYEFFIIRPFGGDIHRISALCLDDAVQIIRDRYGVTTERGQRAFIISTAYEDGNKVITNQKLYFGKWGSNNA